MRFFRLHRALTAWVAILAVLLAALVPTISHAWAARSDAALLQVCTSGGATWQPTEGAVRDPGPAPTGAHLFEHCRYCSLHANDLAIPAAPLAALPAPLLPHLLPAAFLAAPRTLFAWRPAQARAPPQVT